MEAPPVFPPFALALEALEVGGYSETTAFYEACELLCQLFLKITMSPEEPKFRRIKRTNRHIAGRVLCVPGMEEALTTLRWLSPEDGIEHQDLLIFQGDVLELSEAVRQITSLASWVRRRGGPQLVSVTSDPKGWSTEFHEPSVLQRDPNFKGAVWDVGNPRWQPDGVVVFQNSPFSNVWPCDQRIRLQHNRKEFSFNDSEAVIMALKEHILSGAPLATTLCSHASFHTAGMEPVPVTRRSQDAMWHHGMHVLVGTVACWLKFTQDEGLGRLLLATQGALLVSAPDGVAWGSSGDALPDPLATSSEFLGADPQHFAIRAGSETNALGKALMVVRDLLALRHFTPEIVELRETFDLVSTRLKGIEPPFDWQSALRRLEPALYTRL